MCDLGARSLGPPSLETICVSKLIVYRRYLGEFRPIKGLSGLRKCSGAKLLCCQKCCPLVLCVHLVELWRYEKPIYALVQQLNFHLSYPGDVGDVPIALLQPVLLICEAAELSSIEDDTW